MRNVQVNLGFTANTSQAQQAIQQLQTSLNNIANTKITIQGGSIDTAVQSAKQLSQHLAAATNVNTGKLDFTALTNSLRAANTDLSTLSNNLLAMGPKGQEAFSQVANAVAHAELSTRKANKALQSFGVTLMNTIKWQAASSMIHAAMGAFQSAVGHIEKLDKALNSIQIVTNKTSIEMASFAKQAQQLSKALNTTVTEYAEASLIYFQQGLPEREILARTEATIKMAKVTGDAVATVSDQLTAIWNNFDNGSKSLEHYVDVITALGAATASSSKEISDGLQKFAAIAETVGLSYEYAATALATVTSATRESADVVGTAFKTLFARMEGLKLGETLDDGTTLNKYSQALAKVGINIKDANGDLKDMDDILDEMGQRWSTLHKDQQIALAQSVAGVRQYNQLMALMNNWSTFKINLEIAEDSKGALDEQFAIYQNSIEASQTALKNAAETLYGTLLSPDMVKGFNNALTDAIELITRLVDNAGGLNKVLEFGGLLILQMILPKLEGFMLRTVNHLKDFVGLTKAAQLNEIQTMSDKSHAIAGTSQATYNKPVKTPKTKVGQVMSGIGSGIHQVTDKIGTAIVNEHKFTEYSSNQTMHKITGALMSTGTKIQAIKAGENAQNAAFDPTNASNINVQQVGAQVDGIDPSVFQMRTQAAQEEAGFTARILDTKKAIMSIEDGLTDTQKEQFKQYNEKIAHEQELLRLARERQMASAEELEQSQKTASHKAGIAARSKKRKEVAAEVDKEMDYEGQKKKIESADLDDEAKAYQIKQLNEERQQRIDTSFKAHGYDKINGATVNFAGAETKDTAAYIQEAAQQKGSATESTLVNSVMTEAGAGTETGLTANVESLTRMGELQAQYNADAKTAGGLQLEISQAISKQEKGLNKTIQAQKQNQSASKELNKLAQKYGNALENAFDEIASGDKDLQKVANKLKGLAKEGKINLGDLNPDELKMVQSALGKVQGGLKSAGDAAEEMSNAMAADMSESTGQEADMYLQIADNAKVATAEALNANQQSQELQNTVNTELPVQPDIFGSVTQGASQAMSAFTNLAMGAQMLQTGWQTAFDPEANGIERMMGAMTALQGLMSILQGAQAAMNVVDTIAVAIKAAKAAATKKEADADIKDTAATGLNTVATTANAVSKVFAALASKGLAGIIAGALAAALIVGTVLMVKNTIATENAAKADAKKAEEAESAAEETRELAAASKEELETLSQLNDEYEKALRLYKETGSGKAELVDAATDVVSAMEIENGNLLILQGNYELLNEKIREHLRLKGQQANKDAAAGVSGSATSLEATAKSSEGGIIAGQTNKGDPKINNGNGYYTLQFPIVGEEAKWLKEYLTENPSEYWGFGQGGNFGTWYTSDSDLGLRLQELDAIYAGATAYARSQGYSIGEEGGFVQNYNKMSENGEREKWDAVIQADKDADSVAITSARNESGIDSAKTQEEYDKAYEKYMTEVFSNQGLDWNKASDRNSGNGKALIESANKEMYDDEYLGQFEQRRQAIDEAKQSSDSARWFLDGSGNSNGKWSIENWAKENGVSLDEAYEIFFTLKAYPNSSRGVYEAMDEAQKIVDGQALVQEYDLVPTMKQALSEDMSYEDYNTFVETYGDKLFGENGALGGITAEEFGALSYEQQLELLDQYRDGLDVVFGLEQQITGQKALQNDLIKKGADAYAEEYAAAATGITLEQAKALGDWATIDKAKSLGLEWTQEQVDKYNDSYGEGLDNYAYAVEGYDTAIKQAEDELAWRKSDMQKQEITDAGLDVNEVYEVAEGIQDMALSSDELADGLEKDAVAARDVAKEIGRFNKGVDSLSESYDDWMNALSSDNISEVLEATGELADVYADLLDMDASDFSQAFLEDEKNLALAYKAAAGDAQAYNELQQKALASTGEQWNLLASGVIGSLQQIAAIEGVDIGEKITYTHDEHGDLATRIAMDYQRAYDAAIAGGKSAAEAKQIAADMINQAGYNITSFGEGMETRTVTVTGDLPAGWEPQEDGGVIGPDGQPIKGVSWKPAEGGKYTYTQTYMVPKNMEFSKKAETFGGKTVTSSGGGEPKKADKVKKSDVVERYKEVNDRIAETQRLMSKTSAEADGLWGEARFKKMRQGVALLKQENAQLKERIEWSKKYVQEDRKALNDATAAAGFSFEYDKETGNITNYTEKMTWLYNQLDETINKANKDGNVTEDEQKEIDKWQKYVDDIEAARGDYESSLDQWREDEQQWLDNRNQIWQDNFDIMSEELELKVQLNTQDLEILEYYLSKIEDTVYGITEAFATQKFFENEFGLRSGTLGLQNNFYKDLQEQYKNGEIGLPQYKEGVSNIIGSTISEMQSLNALKQSMRDFYGDVLDKAIENIAMFTEEMDHLNSVLDHYSNILDLIGKKDDYATKNKVLRTRANNITNEVATQKKLYDQAITDADYWAKKMQEAVVGSNEYETYKANWKAAQQVANDTQDQMLSKTQEWAETMKSIIENELSELSDKLEESLTGGVSFDNLLTMMERRSSLQEEYLTTTNKIYETNKLMRTAQQEIDKTTNTVAKKRLQNFINETNQLQNQTELSNYELEIQQAKYDLLLAEIALEEAQAAKSTVRLQRDAEGNFGYVYTADQSAVNDAEQKLADAQNNLYNIGLEGANDYQQKYIEIMQESQDALAELNLQWINQEITDKEEFEKRKLEIIEYYGAKLEQYSNLHSIALTTDSRVANDAWTSGFSDMVVGTESWYHAVDSYSELSGEKLVEWSAVCSKALTDSGLNDLDSQLGAINQKSQDLTTILLGEDGSGGVVAAMLKETDAAKGLSEQYISIQNAIDGVITEYEALLDILGKDYKSPTGPGDTDNTQNGEEETDVTTEPKGEDDPDSQDKNTETKENNTGNKTSYNKQQIKALQKWLNTTYNAGLVEDGIWGSQSAAAASKYLNTNSLEDAMQQYLNSTLPIKKGTDDTIKEVEFTEDGSGYVDTDTGTIVENEKDKKEEDEKEEDEKDNTNTRDREKKATVKGYFSSESARLGQGAYTTLSMPKDSISNFTLDRNRKYGTFTYGGSTFYVTQADANYIANRLGITPKYNDRHFLPGQVVSIKDTAIALNPVDKSDLRFSTLPSKTFTISSYIDNKSGEPYYTGYLSGYDLKIGILKSDILQHFDTGGYTGSWGSYGKLAMLHQKELVLNQGDTANFLASMEVLERILQVLDLQSASSQLGGLLYSPGMRDTGSQIIEQNIHIDAQFPNATDRFEIEEAFKSMADLASQYANRK